MLAVDRLLVDDHCGLRPVEQRVDGGTAVVLHHGERVLQLNAVLGQFVTHVAAHVRRHRLVPGQQYAGQVTGAGRFFGAVQQHRPRVFAVQHVRIVNAFICAQTRNIPLFIFVFFDHEKRKSFTMTR